MEARCRRRKAKGDDATSEPPPSTDITSQPAGGRRSRTALYVGAALLFAVGGAGVAAYVASTGGSDANHGLPSGALVALVVQAARRGDYDDWEGPSARLLHDDDSLPEREGGLPEEPEAPDRQPPR